MKLFTKIILCLLALPALVMCTADDKKGQVTTTKLNPYLADPTIFAQNGTYYLYGTKGDPNIPGEGFLVYTSTDLEIWSGPAGLHDGFAFKKGDGYGDTGFWAPQIFQHNNKFYMAYTANEHIAIAESNSPLGPFTNVGNPIPSDGKQIDPFVFFDNGKIYLYHVRLDDGNRVFVAELEDDLSAVKPGTLTECVHATEQWENTQNASWGVTEGPTVFKNGNLYYLVYSANDFRNPDYAVGYATSSSPTGPWVKQSGSPIISKTLLGYPGTGHGDIFYDAAGTMQYVFHTHFSPGKVDPRKTAIVPLSLNSGVLSLAPGAAITWPLVE